MMVVGLTGGIGSGKTTVARFFKAYGIPVYIADDEAKSLMLKAPIKSEITALFGQKAYTVSGQLNRKYLSSQVFKDKDLLQKLNAIVHPRVRADFKQWASKQNAPYVLYEAAILFESGQHRNLADYSILVTAPKQDRILRVKKRDQISEKQIEARMENQWSDERKKSLADWVIDNRDLASTQSAVYEIHHRLLDL